MATSEAEIRGWFERGVAQKATHLIVVCDTFSYNDYPVYVKVGEDPRAKANEYQGKEMCRLMEVYALHLPLEPQLAEHRAYHYESPPPERLTALERIMKDDA